MPNTKLGGSLPKPAKPTPSPAQIPTPTFDPAFELNLDDAGNVVDPQSWNNHLQEILARDNKAKQAALKELHENYLRFAGTHAHHSDFLTELEKKHLANIEAIHNVGKARGKAIRDKYAAEYNGKPLDDKISIEEALQKHANNVAGHYFKLVPRLHRKISQTEPPELETVPFKYEPPRNAKGVSPEYQKLVTSKFNTPLRYGAYTVPTHYKGLEAILDSANSQVTLNNHYKEPDYVAKALNARAKGLDIKGVKLSKTAREHEVRPSVNHALSLLFGGGLLPPGVASALGKSGFSVAVIPHNHRMSHGNTQLHEFFNNPDIRAGEVGGKGGRFLHVREGNKEVGYIHEPRDTEIPLSHQKTVASGAALAGRAYYSHIVREAKRTKNPETAKAISGLEQNARELGFANGSQLMSHLMQHYAMSGYSAASELGDEKHNIYGGQPMFNQEDREHQLLSFLHNLDERSSQAGKGRAPGLADNVFKILQAGNPNLGEPEDIKQNLEHGVPTAEKVGIPVKDLGTQRAKPVFPETEAENKQLDEEAKHFKTSAKVTNASPTRRPKVEHAIRKALSSYAPGIQDLLKNFHVNLYSPDSPHPNAAALSKDYPESELPHEDEERETGMNTAHIGVHGGKVNRQLHMILPTQKGEHAAAEAKNTVENQVGRHIFATLGGLEPGRLGQGAMQNFIFAADQLVKNLPGQVLGKRAAEMERESPEFKYIKDLDPKNPERIPIARGAHMFNNIFKDLHEYIQKNNPDQSPSGVQRAFNKFAANLPNDLAAKLLGPVQGQMSGKEWAALKNRMSNQFHTIADSFIQLMKPLYFK